jgi:hypothetical protein
LDFAAGAGFGARFFASGANHGNVRSTNARRGCLIFVPNIADLFLSSGEMICPFPTAERVDRTRANDDRASQTE